MAPRRRRPPRVARRGCLRPLVAISAMTHRATSSPPREYSVAASFASNATVGAEAAIVARTRRRGSSAEGGVGLEFSWGEVRVVDYAVPRARARGDPQRRGARRWRPSPPPPRAPPRPRTRTTRRGVVGVVGGSLARGDERVRAATRVAASSSADRLFPPTRVRLLVSLGASRRRSRPWSCSARACAWAAARVGARAGSPRAGKRGGALGRPRRRVPVPRTARASASASGGQLGEARVEEVGEAADVADLLDDVRPARGRRDHDARLLEHGHRLLPRVGLA